MADSAQRQGPFWFSHWEVVVHDTELSKSKSGPVLPGRECEVCGERELHTELARYDIDPPKSVDRKLLKGENSLSVAEYESLLDAFAVKQEIRDTLLPGTEIGQPTFRLLGRQHDFLCSGLVQIVSESVLQCARERRVLVNAVKVTVRGRAKLKRQYYSLLPTIRSVMDKDWLREEMVQCTSCKQWRLRPGIRLPKKVLIDKAHVLQRLWPKNHGVVYSPDLGNLLYSPEFVDACQYAQLVGSGFKQVSWV